MNTFLAIGQHQTNVVLEEEQSITFCGTVTKGGTKTLLVSERIRQRFDIKHTMQDNIKALGLRK